MKRRYSLLLALLGVFAYLVFLPRHLSPALTVTPEAVYNLVDYGAEAGDLIIPFATDRYVGFLNRFGDPIFTEKVRYGATASTAGMINYDSVSQNLLVQHPIQGMMTPIDTRGYPFYLNERLLVVSTDRLRLKEFSPNGEIRWRITFPSQITTVAGTDERVIIGMLNGSFWFVEGETGDLIHRFEPTGSRIRVAYGAEADSSTGIVLLISGASPQQAFLLEERGGELRQLQQFELESDLRRNVQVFTPLENLFVVEQQDAVLLLDETTLKRRSIPLPGRLLKVVGAADEDLLIALVRREDGEEIVLTGADNPYRGKLVLQSRTPGADLHVIDDRLILLLDDRVLVYRLERM